MSYIPALLLITVASGFVGRAVVVGVTSSGLSVRGRTRSTLRDLPAGAKAMVGLGLSEGIDWWYTLTGTDAVDHCVAPVHAMRDTASDPLTEFWAINTDGTLNIARRAAAAGVCRFVLASSINVNGAESFDWSSAADDQPAPHSPCVVSKYVEEVVLRTLLKDSGMEVFVIRSPLVFELGAQGNFAMLMRALRSGVPLPLGAVDNRWDLIALANLVDLIVVCLTHPAAAIQTFLVIDGGDFSTTDMLRRTAAALDRKARLFPVPSSLLRRITTAVDGEISLSNCSVHCGWTSVRNPRSSAGRRVFRSKRAWGTWPPRVPFTGWRACLELPRGPR